MLDNSNWMAPYVEETLAPYPGYVFSFFCFHERGLTFPLYTFVVTLFDYL